MQYGFVHIPKTGGSTLQDILNRNFSKKDIANLRHDGTSLADIKSAQILKGHVDINVLKAINPNIALLSCVRLPVYRLVSHYSFICSRVNHGNHRDIMDNGYSIIDCIEHRVDTVFDNLLTRYLGGYRDLPFGEINESHLDVAIKNSTKFNWIGILEDFDKSLLILQKEMGLNRLFYRKRKVNTNSQMIVSKLSSEEISYIESSQSLDQTLYSVILDKHREKLETNKDYIDSKLPSLRFKNKVFSGLMSWKND